jgi:hypothetical protein
MIKQAPAAIKAKAVAEPVQSAASFGALITAILAMLVGTEVISPDMSGWVLAIVAAAMPIAGQYVRAKVSPTTQGE